MATWKKIITSGSAAQLSSLTLSTELQIGQGGTGAATQGTARTALGVGPIAGNTNLVTVGTITAGTWTGDSIADANVDNDLTIAGGTVNNTVIGGSTAAAGTFTTVTTSGNVSGSFVSTGSFGRLLGDGSGITNLSNAAINSVTGFGTNDRLVTVGGTSQADGEANLTFAAGVLENKAGVGSKISGSLQSTGSFGHVVGTTYAGDGSGLSGIEIDVDTLDELEVTPAVGDKLLVSDNGDSKKITWARVRDGVFASISDNATVAAGGVLTIADDKVDSQHYVSGSVDLEHIAVNAVNSGQIAAGAVDLAHMSADSVGTSQIANDAVTYGKMQDTTAKSLLGRNSNSDGDVSAITVANTQLVIGNGAGFTTAALSGDVTMANDGEVTIGPAKITDSMLAADVATELAGGGLVQTVAKEIAVNPGDGLEIASDAVAVKLVSGNDTLNKGAAGLKVATIGITPTELNTSVAGSGIAGGGGTALSVDFGQLEGAEPTFNKLTILGDLTVAGTTTTLDTQNLLVEDPMIFAATGSAGNNVDAGLIVQSGSADLSGSAIFHQKLGQRWAVAKGVPASSSVVTPEQYIVTVSGSVSTNPNSTSGSYGVGEMWITNTDDIWIRVG